MTSIDDVETRVTKLVVDLMQKYELQNEHQIRSALIESFQGGVDFWRDVTEEIVAQTMNEVIERGRVDGDRAN